MIDLALVWKGQASIIATEISGRTRVYGYIPCILDILFPALIIPALGDTDGIRFSIFLLPPVVFSGCSANCKPLLARTVPKSVSDRGAFIGDLSTKHISSDLTIFSRRVVT